MKTCEQCGGQVGADDTLTICPTCLFAQALQESAKPDSDSPQESSPGRDPGASLLRRFHRRDFFEKYALQERIGVGGQGEVYRCWDYDLRRMVAMKRLSVEAQASPAAVARFFAEAQVASQLQHPGVLPVYDVGFDPDQRPYFTTVLVAGQRLADVWRSPSHSSGEEPFRSALSNLIRVCEVMAHAHSRGVIHRDLKPSNILIGSFGDVRVIDWGSAYLSPTPEHESSAWWVPGTAETIETDRAEVLRREADSPWATANAGQPVTLLYTAPESLTEPPEPPGPATDIYSIGVMLFELAAGSPPFFPKGALPPNRQAIKSRIMHGPTPSPRAVSSRVSRDLDAVCRKAMAREREGRYAGMLELAADLRALLDFRLVQARPLGTVGQMRKWIRRNRGVAALASVLLLVAGLGATITLYLRLENRLSRQVNALGDARLAARSGQWRSVLDQLEMAERAGYRDRVDLTLQRLEAWSELNSNQVAQTALKELVAIPALNSRHRGAVLLAVGEYELSSLTKQALGFEKIQQALDEPLDAANRAFAQALLADRTTNALNLLRQARRIHPFHRSAFRHCLGLEFLLGLHGELEADLVTFKTLFPDDPSYVLFAASHRAVSGDPAGAESLIAAAEKAIGRNVLDPFRSSVEIFGLAAKLFRDRAGVAGSQSTADVAKLLRPMFLLFAGAGEVQPSEESMEVRFPMLPCLKSYLNTAMQVFGQSFQGTDESDADLLAAHERHPEAFLPWMKANTLEARGLAATNSSRLELLGRAANLHELAADSPSFIPDLPKFARIGAAQAQLRIYQSQVGPDRRADARRRCVRHCRQVLDDPQVSVAAVSALARIALQLGEWDLSRQGVARWEELEPGSQSALRARIALELNSGAYHRAHQLASELLQRKPDSAWASAQREAARAAAEKSLKEIVGESR